MRVNDQEVKFSVVDVLKFFDGPENYNAIETCINVLRRRAKS